MPWRPEGVINPYSDDVNAPDYETDNIYCHIAFEEGVYATIQALSKMAEESPTKTVTIDSRVINTYEVENED